MRVNSNLVSEKTSLTSRKTIVEQQKPSLEGERPLERQEVLKKIEEEGQKNRAMLLSSSRLSSFKRPSSKFPAQDASITTICLGSPTADLESGGWNSEQASKHFAEAFNYMQQGLGVFTGHSFCQKLVEPTKQLNEFFNFQGKVIDKAVFVAKKIKALGANQSYVMPSGWSGAPAGHAMYLRFEKRADGNFDIFVYNANGETSSWNGTQEVHHKNMARPYIKYEGVTLKELFFIESPHQEPDPVIFENLLTLLEPSTKRDRSLKTVLNHFILFQDKFVDSEKLPTDLFISVQRGPNCAAKSFNACMFDLINDKKSFRRHVLDIRLYTILNYYKSFPLTEILSDPGKKVLIYRAAMGLSGLADRSFLNGTINEEEHRTIVATLIDLTDRLEAFALKPTSFAAIDAKKSTTALMQREESAVKPMRRFYLSSTFAKKATQETSKKEKLSFDPKLGLNSDWKGLKGLIEEFMKGEIDSSKKQFQIETLLYNLRDLKQKPLTLSKDEAKQLLESLSLLSSCFSNLSFELGRTLSMSTQNAAMELLAISYQVALQVDADKGILKGYGLWYDYFRRESRKFLFAAHDSPMLDWRNELLNFYSTLPQQRQLFNFDTEKYDAQMIKEGRYSEPHLCLRYNPSLDEDSLNELYFQGYRKYCHYDFDFIGKLKEIAGSATAFLRHDKTSFVQDVIFRNEFSICHSQSRSWTVGNDTSSYEREYLNEVAEGKNESAKKNQTSSDFMPFFESNVWQHAHESILSENEWVKACDQKFAHVLTDLEKQFFGALCEPTLSVSILLKMIADNVEKLSSFQLRALIKAMLFKTIDTEEGTISPLLEALKSDPQIFERLEALTKSALNRISAKRMTAENQDEVQMLLFALRLRATLALKAVELGRKTPESFIKQRQKVFKTLEKLKASDLYAAEIKEESLLTEALLSQELGLKALSEEETAKFFIAYTSLQPSLGVSQKTEDAILKRDFQRSYLNNLPELKKKLEDSAWRDGFIQSCLKKMGISTPFTTCTLKEPFIIEFESAAIGKWRFDIENAEIFNACGKWNPSPIDLPATSAVSRLFSTRKQKLSAFGNFVHFEDRVFGQIRVNNQAHTIERLIDGKWYLYIGPKDAKSKQLHLNNALRFDHTAWLLEEAPGKLVISGLMSGKVHYETKEDGALIEKASSRKFLFEGQNHFPELEFAKNFEDEGQISCYQTSDGKLHLDFPRFKTLSGSVLRFIFDEADNRWRYFENPSYCLETKPLFEFGFSRSLTLTNQDEKKQLLLVPVGNLSSEKSFNLTAAIGLPDGDNDGQKGSLEYCQFEIRGGELKAKSMNDKLYLASLFLATQHYQKAKAILDLLSMSEMPDDRSYQLLEKTMTSSTCLLDSSPNACALRLSLFCHFLKLKPDAKKLDTLNETVKKFYKIYLEGANAIDQSVFLKKEEELALIETLMKQIGAKDDSGRLFFVKRQSELQDLIKPVDSQEVAIESDNRRIKFSSSQFPWPVRFLENDRNSKKGYFEEASNDSSVYEMTNLLLSKGIEAVESQKMLYQLAQMEKAPDDSQSVVLCYAALLQEGVKAHEIPLMPPKDAPFEVYSQWWDQLNALYKKHSFKNENRAIILKKPKKQISSKNLEARPKENKPLSGNTQPPDAMSFNEPLETWKAKFLDASAPKNKTLEAEHLEEKNLSFRKAYYAREKKIAREANEQKPQLKKDVDLAQLKIELESRSQVIETTSAKLERFISSVANKEPASLLDYTRFHADALKSARQKHSIEKICLECVKDNWKERLTFLNSHLTEKEVDALRTAALDYMVEKTELDQLKRILLCLARLEQADENEKLFAKEALAHELSVSRSYDKTKDFFPLFFEFKSGMRLRSSQATVVQKALPVLLGSDHKAGLVFQLKMGGGKTNVILSQLVEIAAETGKIPCVFSHYSQFASIRSSLQSLQKSRFNKDLYTLDYSLEDLSDPNILNLILERFKDAKINKVGVAMKSSLPQVIQLKFIQDCLKLSSIADDEKPAFILRLKQLAEILTILENDIVSFYDECDLIYSMMTEVNVPLGDAENFSPEKVELVAEAYKFLLDPEIVAKTKLLQNEQDDVDHKTLRNQILPFVYGKLFEKVEIGLFHQPHLKPAFFRFLTQKIAYEDQLLADDLSKPLTHFTGDQKENIELLRKFNEFEKSGDRYQLQSLELIALLHLMGESLFTIAFSKRFNRGYGPDPLNPTGAIVPYLGPDSPAKTRFGFMYLSLMLHLQASIVGEIKKEEISFLADKMTTAAEVFAIKEKVHVDKTLEAELFFELTGVELSKIREPDALEKAYEYLNDQDFPLRRLSLRQEVAAFHVKYHPEYLCANAVNLVEHTARNIAGSGTVWNWPTYAKQLGEPVADIGSEGSILNEIIEKNALHKVESSTLASIFDVIGNHQEKSRIRGLIDSGGFLVETGEKKAKKSKYSSIPPKILEYFDGIAGTDIRGVIYLQRHSREEVENGLPEETFMLWKKGAKKPVPLGGQTEDEVLKHGIPLENLFTLFDELRSTGTDLPMAKDTVCLQTVDPRMPMRTLLQGVLRARGYGKGQKVEQLVTTESAKELLKGVKKGDELKAISEKLMLNEEKLIGEQTLRSYPTQMVNYPRAFAFRSLCQSALAQDGTMIEKQASSFRSYLVHRADDSLWKAQGRIKQQVPTIDFLKTFGKEIADEMQNIGQDILSEINPRQKKLLKAAKNDRHLPKTVSVPLDKKLDGQVELVQEKEVELDLEKDLSLNQEIAQEHESYQNFGSGDVYKEKAWNINLHNGNLRLQDLNEEITGVQGVLNKTYKKHGRQACLSEYSACFLSNLFMTKNLEYSYTTPTPILDRNAKKGNFMLVIEEGGVRNFLMLSKKDAAYFKGFFGKNAPQNAWLVDMDGRLEIGDAAGYAEKFAEDSFSSDVQSGIWQANVFNGNMAYLETHHEYSITQINEKKELFGRFLTLRNKENEKGLRQVLYSSLVDVSAIALKLSGGVVFSKRRALIREIYLRYQNKSKEEVRNLELEEIQFLGPHQIKWLQTKEQISHVPNSQLKFIKLSQIALVSDERIEHLLNRSLIESIPDEKLQFLSDAQIKMIREKKTIQKLEGGQVNKIKPKYAVYLLESQIQHLVNGNVAAYIAPNFVRHLDKKLYCYLSTKEQVAEVKNEEISRLGKGQIPLLADERIALLTTKKQINSVSPFQVQLLSSKQIKLLENKELVAELKGEKANLIDPKAARYLNKDAVPFVKDKKIAAGIAPECVEYLKSDLIVCLKKKEQLANLSKEKLRFINKAQVKLLSDEQLRLVKGKSLVKGAKKVIAERRQIMHKNSSKKKKGLFCRIKKAFRNAWRRFRFRFKLSNTSQRSVSGNGVWEFLNEEKLLCLHDCRMDEVKVKRKNENAPKLQKVYVNSRSKIKKIVFLDHDGTAIDGELILKRGAKRVRCKEYVWE